MGKLQKNEDNNYMSESIMGNGTEAVGSMLSSNYRAVQEL